MLAGAYDELRALGVFRSMSGLLDWWYRIRRVVQPPGTPATRPAIPAEIGAASAAELAPVFAHVDRLEPELQAAESAGDREAGRVLTGAVDDAGRILAEGRERSAAVRAEAAAKRTGEVEADAHELERRAAENVAAVERAAHAAIPSLVAEAVTLVRTFAAAPVGRAPAIGES